MLYTRTITAQEEAILKNDLLDIKDWIDKAIEGKINSCLKRAAVQYRNVLISENAATAPVKDIDTFKEFIKRSDYKDRHKRDEDERNSSEKIS